MASLRRLGALSAPAGATCAIQSKGTGDAAPETCGHLLDAKLQHPAICKIGPAGMRPHRALAGALAQRLRSTGAEVDLERTVVELARYDPDGKVTEAILDLYVTFPGSTQPFYIDVTIRCPHAARYQKARRIPAYAASLGVQQKEARYGPKVIAVALETYGRIAPESLQGLEWIAARAGSNLRDRWAAPRLLPTWCAALQRAVVYATADIDLLCLGTHAEGACGLRGSTSE